MASHFSTIGFEFSTPGELETFFEAVAPATELINCRGGQYLCWKSTGGAEMWFQLDPRKNVVGITPFFRGPARLRVALTAYISRPDDTQLEGAIHGWAAPRDDSPESGMYPFVFDLVDKGVYGDLDFPFVSPVQIAAFAHEMEIFANDEEFEATQSTEIKFAPESFIPSGLFSPSGKNTQPPQSEAVFTGHVLASNQLHNPYTKLPFHWIQVRTLGGEFDVVVAPELVTKPIQVGGVVSGSFWLCGQIEKPRVQRRKSWRDVLFRR